MPQLLTNLMSQPIGNRMPVPESVVFEVEIAKGRHSTIDDMDHLGKRSALACPDCHGVMWELDEGELVRYRCHVGHTYTAEMMSIALDETVRRALDVALRALEERLALARKLEHQAENNGQAHLAASWARRAYEFQAELDTIRNSIARLDEIAAGARDHAAE
jgi:two-component system chemotaxis response regulator CheB